MARSVEERSIDVPHEHSANLQSFPQLATEMVRVPESEITSPTLVAIDREHIGNDDRESTSVSVIWPLGVIGVFVAKFCLRRWTSMLILSPVFQQLPEFPIIL